MASTNKKTASTRPKAATTDVLGSPRKEERVPSKWSLYHDRLVQVRNYLLTRQDDLVKDAKEEQSSFSLHMADAATGSFDRDLVLSRASSEQEALYEIDEALERIRDGSYGTCELTGKPIEPARLEAIPWTRFSLEAEETLEKQGAVPRARPAPREPVVRSGGADSEAEGDVAGDQDDRE